MVSRSWGSSQGGDGADGADGAKMVLPPPVVRLGPVGSWPQPWATWQLAWVVALVLASFGNLTLWRNLYALPEVHGWRGLGFGLLFGGWVTAVLTALLAPLTLWPRVLRAVAGLALVTAAVTSHFMGQYAVVIDSSMLLNAVQTDVREVRDLLSWPLALWLLAGVGAAVGVWRVPLKVPPRRWPPALALLGGGGVVAALCLGVMFQDFASLMRNHKQIRYQINPLNTGYAAARVLAAAWPSATPQAHTPIGTDAQLGASYAGQTRAPLLVLVVGETARAANVSLGGYGQDSGRDTTPALRALQARGLAPQGQKEGQLHYFSQVTSCGTNTQASVPCMFSHHGKEGHESQSGSFDNLLDVLQRAGLAVLWLDNQSGCKGVCDRVTHINTREHTDARYCTDGECLDEVMLSVLDAQLAALPPQRTAQGVVVVLHQMGSHGPAYHKRSPPAHKAFMPECTSNALPDCSHQELINAYDNSLRYTDHFLSQTVQWLQRQPAQGAMLYVSDHGESLGEHNLYLHGLPYALAPQVQKHVPMVTWLSESVQQRLRLNTTCLSQRTAEPLSHDHLFHSVLGLMDVQTQAYRAELDALAPCRGGTTAPLTPSSPLIRG